MGWFGSADRSKRSKLQLVSPGPEPIKNNPWGGSPGLVVMRGGSCSEGRGFESQRRILDRQDIFSH